MKALLLVDFQKESFESGRLKEHKQTLIKNTNELINICRDKMPIIWVTQQHKIGLADSPLYNKKHNRPIMVEGSDGCQILDELYKHKEDYEIIKKRFSAFFKTNLKDLANELGITTFIVAGVNTMSCVRTTCIDAYQLDYDVILALDCVDAYDVEQHENSLKYLQYSITKGKANKQIGSLL